MIRTWQCAVVVSTALALVGCQRLASKLSHADAGTTEEAEAAAAAVELQTDAGGLGAPAASAVASAESAHKALAVRCAGGEVAVLLQPDEETCVVECKSAAACPPGWACDGEGPLAANGRPGQLVRFCRAAGHVKALDGGLAHPGAVAADAGKATPLVEPPARKLDVKMVAGQCPGGYHPCGVACRLACGKDSDCGLATAHCQAGLCVGPGALPCGK